jgi:protein with PEP-CTERM/exosortase system signal
MLRDLCEHPVVVGIICATSLGKMQIVRRKYKNMKTLKIISVVVAIGVLAGLCQVKADTFNFQLTTADIMNPGPYANVSVMTPSLNSNTAVVSFTSLTNGGNIYLFGGNNAVGVNVNASTWTIGMFSGSNSGTGFTAPTISNGGAGTMNGFGSFNQQVALSDGFTSSVDHLSFVLTDTSGTWANASSVLTANASGFLAAAHIFVTTSPANAANGASITGFAAGPGGVPPPPPPPPSVPDGGTTLMLLGSALGGVELLRRFFSR